MELLKKWHDVCYVKWSDEKNDVDVTINVIKTAPTFNILCWYVRRCGREKSVPPVADMQLAAVKKRALAQHIIKLIKRYLWW